jgi:hypothetical protein
MARFAVTYLVTYNARTLFILLGQSGALFMPEIKHVNAASGDVLLLVGTMKGAFILRSDSARQTWDVGGPYFPGRAIYAMAYDDRNGRKRLWAAVNSSFWGSYLSSSDDYGKTWTEPEAYGVKFPEDTEASVKQIWQWAIPEKRTRSIAELSPRRCSNPPTPALRGHW